MQRDTLAKLISSQTLLADGAMGTMLHSHGIGFDKHFAFLKLNHIDR